MLLKCTKNLVVGGQILIMKHDVIKIIGSDLVEPKGGEPVKWYDCVVKESEFYEDMEVSLPIHTIAEHFEYLNIPAK